MIGVPTKRKELKALPKLKVWENPRATHTQVWLGAGIQQYNGAVFDTEGAGERDSRATTSMA